MYMQGGTVVDAAVALLFRMLSQPALLFPPPPQIQESDHPCILPEEATAKGIASMLSSHGLEVEWRICMMLETAYGLIPLSSSSSVDLPEMVAISLQPPMLSWSLYIPLLEVLQYLPHGSPSEACLTKIFVATVEAVLRRTMAPMSSSKNLAIAELHTMVHSLFLGPCASVELASRLISVVLTVCVTHEGQYNGSKQGPIAAFDSYIIAAVCALSSELHTYSLVSKQNNQLDPRKSCRVIDHTRRMLAILETLVSLELSSLGTSWSSSSTEIVATVIVAAHVSDVLRHSKACMQALLLLMRRKWDKEIHSRASSLLNIIEFHHKTVASVADRGKPAETGLMQACFHRKKRKTRSVQASTLLSESTMGSFLALSSGLGHIGFYCREQILSSVLSEKQESCFLVVSLLWHVLISSPEIQPRTESTSAQEGWRKVVDALSKVVSASPAKTAEAVIFQADRDLKPWTVNDNDVRINQRIVKVIGELMSNHENTEALMVLASASDLLLRATDGILVDVEACILPQLELLEAAARSVKHVVEWGESGLAVANGISNLLKVAFLHDTNTYICPKFVLHLMQQRLLVTCRSVSHPSAHVRALSVSILRAVVHAASMKSHCLGVGIAELKDDVKNFLAVEACSRLETGLPIHFIEATAKELGCSISTSNNL